MRNAIDLDISDDLNGLSERAADWFVQACAECLQPFAVSLSGGATPKRLYQLLASPPRQERLPWPLIHWFLGDERFVPFTDERSNFRMIHEAMAEAPVPDGNFHAVPTEGLTPADAARAYEAVLRSFYGCEALEPQRPLFHATFLGLGEDGHTASLFPGSPALDESTRWVSPVSGAAPEPRITLTRPALDSSRFTVFLVAGASKANALRRLLAHDSAIPAGRLAPQGRVLVFADRSACGGGPG